MGHRCECGLYLMSGSCPRCDAPRQDYPVVNVSTWPEPIEATTTTVVPAETTPGWVEPFVTVSLGLACVVLGYLLGSGWLNR